MRSNGKSTEQLDIESMQKKRIVVLQEKVSEISKTHRTKKDKMKNLRGEKRQKYGKL